MNKTFTDKRMSDATTAAFKALHHGTGGNKREMASCVATLFVDTMRLLNVPDDMALDALKATYECNSQDARAKAMINLEALRAMGKTCAGLRRIVEEIDGAMNHGTWRDEHGARMKDTPEWVEFYNAVSDLRALIAQAEAKGVEC